MPSFVLHGCFDLHSIQRIAKPFYHGNNSEFENQYTKETKHSFHRNLMELKYSAADEIDHGIQ